MHILTLTKSLLGEIDLNTYKAEKAACDGLLLKTKNAYAAVLASRRDRIAARKHPTRFPMRTR